MSETALLLALHRYSNPLGDALFRASHELGTLGFLIGLVLATCGWHRLRGERREARAWLAVGVTTLALFLLLKPAFARPRPELWPRLVTASDFSFPSGHALGSAAFYPLFAWTALRLRGGAFALVSVLVPLFVGLGRLYLGVHWPTDVLAGWALGAVQAAAAIRWLRRPDRASVTASRAAALMSALFAASAVVVSGSAQEPSAPSRAEPRPSFRVDSELVVVDLLATDLDQRFVRDLRLEEIRVTENGVRRPVR